MKKVPDALYAECSHILENLWGCRTWNVHLSAKHNIFLKEEGKKLGSRKSPWPSLLGSDFVRDINGKIHFLRVNIMTSCASIHLSHKAEDVCDHRKYKPCCWGEKNETMNLIPNKDLLCHHPSSRGKLCPRVQGRRVPSATIYWTLTTGSQHTLPRVIGATTQQWQDGPIMPALQIKKKPKHRVTCSRSKWQSWDSL